MSALDTARKLARRAQARVVFAETDDARVAEAAAWLSAEGLVRPVPLAAASQAQIEVLQKQRPLKAALARRMLSRPLYRAAAMLGTGEADVMVAGATCPSRRVIEAAAMAVGPAAGCATPSAFFVMSLPDGREIIFADCALNVAPDAAQLADIARASARSAERLLGRAEVALLSFSTGTSGAGKSVETIREAAEISGFSGPVQADTALNAAIAAAKGVAGGSANTLIFPTLDAGNIAYKLIQELAGAQAIGPLLQGFRRPVCDLSRGASVDDIIAATLLTIALGAR